MFPESATLDKTAFKVKEFQKKSGDNLCTIMQSI